MRNMEATAKLRIEAEISEASQSLKRLEGQISNLWGKTSAPKTLLSSIDAIREKLGSLDQFTQKDYLNREEVQAAQREYKAIKKEIHDLQTNFRLLSVEQKKSLLSSDVKSSLEARTKAMKAYAREAEKVAEHTEKTAKLEQSLAEKQARLDEIKKSTSVKTERAAKVQRYNSLIDNRKRYESQIDTLSKNPKYKTGEGYDNPLTRAIAERDKINKSLRTIKFSDGELEAGTKELQDFEAQAKELEAETEELKKVIDGLNKEIGELKAQKPVVQTLDQLKKKLKDLGVEGLDSANDVQSIQKVLDSLEAEELKKLEEPLRAIRLELAELDKQADDAGEGIRGATDSLKEQDEVAANTEAFKERIKQFIGLQGAAMMMKKALENAFTTIKNLDAAMTEMAVVTDLDIGDYWDQLPEYTKRANELGLAIQDVYEADTLFYQQGLKTNEVVQISTETMKMARIAGLDTAEATNRMTAALRGFNMELNEANAQNIADVYSELAAITASDVDEISAAMTKTASIASSAGMEFETTAAFLAQIIETTRESAETAGTAMKTVIARFQELKKDPSEIGEVEGEIVDANKIETALRSVGVALRDSSGQFRELDDVFMELAQKWDSLDKNTQRYIATIAAGSRQQSRFIAMMSNYGRTVELVNAANNSAGASTEQYEKTLDSIETKLTKLENAWQEFSTGLLNSDLVKFAVDFLTSLLTALNKVTEGFGGITSSLSKISTLVAIFQTAKIVIKKFFDNIIKEVYQSARQAGESIGSGVQDGIRSKEEQASRLVGFSGMKDAKGQMKTSRDKLTKLYASKQEKEDLLKNGWGPKLTKEEIDKIKQEIIELNKKIEKGEKEWRAGFDKLCEGAQQAAQTISMVGVGIGMIGQLFVEAGFEEVGNSLQTASKWITMFGTGLMSAIPLVKLLGVTFKIEGNKIVIAGVKSQAAWWWIFAVVAAVAALAVGVAMVGKVMKQNSAETKLASMASAAEEAAQAAEELTAEYHNLKESLEDIDDLSSNLDGMIKGTKAWQEQVEKLNNEVLELIKKYPTLAKFIANKDGVLTIDLNSPEVQAELQRAKDAANRASATATSLEATVLATKDNVAYENLSPNAKIDYKDPEVEAALAWTAVTAAGVTAGAGTGAAAGAGIGAIISALGGGFGAGPGAILGAFLGGMGGGFGAQGYANEVAEMAAEDARAHNVKNQEVVEQLASAIAAGDIIVGANGYELANGLSKERFEADYSVLKVDEFEALYDELGSETEALRTFGEALNETSSVTKDYYDSIAIQIYNATDKTTWTDDQKQVGQGLIDSTLMTSIRGDIDAELQEVDFLDKNLSEDLKNRRDAAIQAQFGAGASLVENEDGGYSIADITGTVKVKDANRDFLKSLVAGYETNVQTEQVARNIPQITDTILSRMKVDGVDETETKKAVVAALADETGASLTKAQKDILKKFDDKTLQKIYDSSTILQDTFGSESAFIEAISKPRGYATDNFDKLDTYFENTGIDKQGLSKLTAGALQGLVSDGRLEQLYDKGTPEEITAFEQAFNKILGYDNAEEIIGKMNAITDWSNLEELTHLEYILQEQYGVSAEDATALAESMAEASDATAGLTTTLDTFGKFYQATQLLNKYLQELADLEWEYQHILSKRGNASNISQNLEMQKNEAENAGYEALKAYQEAEKERAEHYGSGATLIEGVDLTELLQLDPETGLYDPELFNERIKYLGEDDQKKSKDWFDTLINYQKTSADQIKIAKDQYVKLQEIAELEAESYWSLYDLVSDVIVSEMEEQIDSQKELLDATESANEAVLNKMQDQIDKDRQARSNQKAEKNIADLYSKLAYEQMRSGGGASTEVAALQDEISQAEEDYQDSLIDQTLSELQDANKAASEQREKQITLAEQQLDLYKNSAQFQSDSFALMQQLSESYQEAEKNNQDFRKTALGRRITEAIMDSMSPQEILKKWNDIGLDIGNSKDLMDRIEKGTVGQNGFADDIESTALSLTDDEGKAAGLLSAIEQNTAIDRLIGQSAFENASSAGRTATTFATETGLQIKGADTWKDNTPSWDNLTTTNNGVATVKTNEANDYTSRVDTIATTSNTTKLRDANTAGVEQYNKSAEEIRGDNIKTDLLSKDQFYDAINSGEKIVINGQTFSYDSIVSWLQGKNKHFTETGYGYDAYVQQYKNANQAAWNKPLREQALQNGKNLVNELEQNKDVFRGMRDVVKDSQYEGYLTSYTGAGGSEEDFKKALSEEVTQGTAYDVSGQTFASDLTSVLYSIDGKKYSLKTSGTPASIEEENQLQELFGFSTTQYGWDGPGQGWTALIGDEIYHFGEIGMDDSLGYDAYSRSRSVGWKKILHTGSYDQFKEAYLKKLRAYETGGLADFTGPAWLDGTKAHPELVLNQKDTQNFIALKDILSEVMKHNLRGEATNNSGDNYYEIAINVDKLDSDYDVEQIADKIRDMIYKDATYRNVNALNQKI